MGAIQNSLNSVLATAAVASAAGKHAQEKKELEEEKGLLAKEQFYEAKADSSELIKQEGEAKATLDQKIAISDALALKKPGGKGNTKAKLEQSRMAALSEREAAQRAFDELRDRIEAKSAMMQRAYKIMKRTGIIGE